MKKLACLFFALMLLFVACGREAEISNLSSGTDVESKEISASTSSTEDESKEISASTSSTEEESKETSASTSSTEEESKETSASASSTEDDIEHGSSDRPANDLFLSAEGVKYIHITTLPENLDIKCYSSSDIERVINYFSLLTLESDFPENPDEYMGMAYDVIIKYENGETREFIHFGSFLKEVGFDWRKMSDNEARGFENIVSILDTVPSDLNSEELIRLAEERVASEYGIADMSQYKLMFRELNDGRFKAEFDLYISGYATHESYWVTFASDGEIIDTTDINGNEYSRYLPYISEESIKEAEDKLKKSLEKHNRNSGFYISIDNEGYLCLSAEVIVEYEVSDTDGDGFIEGGCGIDHEHIFYSERISSKAFLE